MFWGLIMEPFKRYSQTVQKGFHITNAALDATTGDGEICQVMVGAKGKDFLVCTLQKGKNLQVPLQLFFQEGNEISFTSSGKCVIHLTGFLDPDNFLDGEEEEEDSELEDGDESIPALVPIKKDKKRKADSSPDEKTNANSKKQKNKQSKKLKLMDGENDSDSESVGENDIAKLLQDDDESDENDDTYIPNETSEVSIAESDEDGDDSEDEDDDEDDEDDDDDEDDSDAEEAAPQVPSPKEQKQKNKKGEKPQQNGFAEKKNKTNKENEEKPKQANQEDKAAKEKKVLPGNVGVEDLKVGQGQVAKPGKMVQVYYEGRLKSNNKMFDSCQKGPGFKFKLGKKEVISGWDVGVVGMKVGGKRRIVCPPGMAYGKKGSPPVIPPNSTLVFEVELRGVN